MDDTIQELVDGGMEYNKALLKGVEQYAAEAAILKVAASEVLDFVVDEAVQIYGGMGYSAESPVERAYRDSRINRIFEGTNEINRMLTVDMLLKKAMKGELDLLGPAQKVADELLDIPDFGDEPSGIFGNEDKNITNFKKLLLLIAGGAAKTLGMNLAKEQEVLMNISDIAIGLYMAESTLLRTKKLIANKGEAACEAQIAMTKTYIYDTADRLNKCAKDAINSFATGDELMGMTMGVKRFTKTQALNIKEQRRLIAQKMIDANSFCY